MQGLIRIQTYIIDHQTRTKTDRAVQTRNINQSNVNLFCILPRGVLRNIFLCLDLRDVSRLAECCKVFSAVSHSRSYQLSLYSLHRNRKKANKLLKDPSYTFAMGATRSNSRAFDDEDMSEQDTLRLLNSANATNNLLAEKMKLRDAKIHSFAQHMELFRKTLQSERHFSDFITRKHIALRKEYEDYMQTHPDEQLKVCYLTDQQAKEVQTTYRHIEELEKQLGELKKHRQILRNEVKRMREETGQLRQQLSTRKEDVGHLRLLLTQTRSESPSDVR